MYSQCARPRSRPELWQHHVVAAGGAALLYLPGRRPTYLERPRETNNLDTSNMRALGEIFPQHANYYHTLPYLSTYNTYGKPQKDLSQFIASSCRLSSV